MPIDQDRRSFLAASSATLLVASSPRAVATPAPQPRLIATEEAFAPPQYISEMLKLAGTIDTPGYRYLKLMYGKPEVVRQLTDLEYRLVEMDKFAVDMHLLSIATPGVQAFDADFGSELATLANDELAAAIKVHPTRFAGLAAVAPQAPERAAQEVERAINRLGLNGLIINSHTHGEYLDNPKFWPVLEAAVAHKAPIYLHPTFPSDAMIAPYDHYGMMGALWGFGQECSLHVVRIILGGVLDRFPDLQIVLGHLGEGLPFWLARLDNRYQNILRRGGLEPLGMKRLSRLPSEYFRSNFHITTAGMSTNAPLQFCIDMVGEDRVMFAVDYPFEQTAEAVPFLRAAPLSDRAMRKVSHENAERVFRIAANT